MGNFNNILKERGNELLKIGETDKRSKIDA